MSYYIGIMYSYNSQQYIDVTTLIRYYWFCYYGDILNYQGDEPSVTVTV